MIVLILAVVTALALLAPPGIPPAKGAFTVVNISQTPGVQSFKPSVGTSGAAVIVLWLECNPTCRLAMSRSIDGGATWTAAVFLSSPSYAVRSYDWTVAGPFLFVTWEGDTTDVYFRRSTDSGASWGAEVNLSNSPGVSSRWPHVAASGGKLVYVTWRENIPSHAPEVYLRRSGNAGSSFSAAQNLSGSLDADSFTPAIVASGPNVYVAWPEHVGSLGTRVIAFRRSADGGATWTARVIATPDATMAFLNPDFHPLAAAGENVYIGYEFSLDGRLQVGIVRSMNSGATFLPQQILSTERAARGAHVLLSGPFVFALWGEYFQTTFATGEVVMRRSLDGGATWSTLRNISENESRSDADQSAWAISGPALHAVWMDSIGNGDILYRRSANAGDTFGSGKVNISDTSAGSNDPQLVVNGRDGFIVWTEYGDSSPASTEIYLARTTDGQF